MKSFYTSLLLLFGIYVSALAQEKVPVFFSNKTKGLEGISLVVKSLPDSNIIYTTVLNDSLTIVLLANQKYVAEATATGKQKLVQAFTVKQLPVSVMLLLKDDVSNLQNVVVVSKKPLITRIDDKEIIDVEPLTNSSTNAFEVLEKTPGAIIDQDGNVYLSSTTPAVIFINGREMKLSSADVASLLKSLPANSISKVEILRTPSAKYDANSSGGIVNIILKKGVKLGLNGSVNISSFQGKKNTSSVGVNLNNNTGKWNMYGSYQFTRSNNFEELSSNRFIFSDTSKVAQNAYTTYPNINNYLAGGIDYQLNKKINIGYDFNTSVTNYKSFASNTSNIIKTNNGVTQSTTIASITNLNKSVYFNNALRGKWQIDSAGSLLETEFSFSGYNSNNTQLYQNNIIIPNSITIKGDGKTKNIKSNYEFRTDFTYKLPAKITLEAGLKLTGSNSNNDADYFIQKNNSPRVKDSFQTNSFQYTEKISATYLQLSKKFFGFTLKPGLRLESTNINGQQLIPSDTSFGIKRTDLFPYVFLSHGLFKIFKNELIANAIFRKSITRPYYENLNPYLKYIDQYLFETGNPNLKPQFTTNYELNVTYDNFPVLSVGVNDTKDIFSNVTYQDEATKIAYRTYDNLGKNHEFYVRGVGGIPPGGKFFFYIGGRYNANTYKGFYQNTPLNYKYDGWVFFMYQEYKISKTLNVNTQAFMRTKGLQNFYEIGSFGGVYFGLNKNLWKSKATLSLSLKDAFYTNPVNFRLNQGNISADGRRANDSRRVGIKLRYNFGIKSKKQDDNFGNPVEGAQ